MSNNNYNKQSFKLIKSVSKSFSLISTGISVATTLIARFISGVNTSFTPSFQMVFSIIMRSRTIKLTSMIMRLITRPLQSINSRRVKIVYSLRERLKATLPITILDTSSVFVSLRQKLVSTIVLKRIKATYSPTLATFFILGFFDPQTLATLDTETLGEMDYTS